MFLTPIAAAGQIHLEMRNFGAFPVAEECSPLMFISYEHCWLLFCWSCFHAWPPLRVGNAFYQHIQHETQHLVGKKKTNGKNMALFHSLREALARIKSACMCRAEAISSSPTTLGALCARRQRLRVTSQLSRRTLVRTSAT